MKHQYTLSLMAVSVAVLAMANIFCGSVDIPADFVWRLLKGEPGGEHAAWAVIIKESRIPQMIIALLCGASLGTCGLLLQTAFRNPLAGPSILGIDAGANLGVALVLLGGGFTLGGLTASGFIGTVIAAMAGALCVMSLLLTLSQWLKQQAMLLITGVVIGNVTGSIIQLLVYGATEQGTRSFVMWGMGSFAGAALSHLPVFVLLTITGLVAATLLAKPLDALLLGDRYAQNLGISIHRTRQSLLLVTGLLTAATTSYCGPIAFLGLAVPHIARLGLRTSRHLVLIPGTMLTGSVLTLSCNLISTLPDDGSVIPINVITPLIGAPVILYVIFRQKSS